MMERENLSNCLVDRSRFWKIQLALIFFAIGLLLILLSACSPSGPAGESDQDVSKQEFKTSQVQPDAKISTPVTQSPKNEDCPALDSQLYNLIQMLDPAESAKQLGLNVNGDKIQVLITLENEDASFLVNFDADVGTQSANQVQAYVPFSQLCQLANWESVQSVRPAAQAVPLN